MDKLLKEAIADAKTLRETAIASAKVALEEAFMPKIQSMLSTKISEETDDSIGDDEMDEAKDAEGNDDANAEEGDEESYDDMDEAKGDEDDIDLDEILAEIEAEDKEKTDEAKGDDSDEDDIDEAKGDDEETEEVDEAAKSDDDEEVDLDELLSSLGETKDADEDDEKEEVAELKSELKEAKKTITTLRSTLNEVNLLNAKLLYVTRLIKENEMSKEQKVKILECFDKAKTVREVRLIHSTIAGSFSKKSNTGKTKLAEGRLNFASRSAGKSTKVIPEVDETVARFKKLANLK